MYTLRDLGNDAINIVGPLLFVFLLLNRMQKLNAYLDAKQRHYCKGGCCHAPASTVPKKDVEIVGQVTSKHASS